MKHNIRLICLSLVLALLLGLVGCVTQPAPTTTGSLQTTAPTTTQQATTVPTQPTTAPTEPTEPTTAPTEPTEPADPNALVFELTEADFDEFYRLMDECEAVAMDGTDLDAVKAANEAMDEMYNYIQAQCSIAQVLYYSDMTDEALTQQYMDSTDSFTTANDAYIQMARRLHEANTPAHDVLFEGWTQADFDSLMAYESRVSELSQRNTEIEVAYQAETDDEAKIQLYIELVQNYNEIASIYGYDNYYTYAYEVSYERDYTRREVGSMRDYAEEYLAYCLVPSLENFYDSYDALSSSKQYNISALLYNDYRTDTWGYLKNYLSTTPQTLQDHMNQMLEADSLFATAEGAMAGAFTTAIGERSYCFFGPGYTNAFTVAHEGGHYYASRYTDLNAIPLDLAETHSQGNEWLFMYSIGKKMQADQYEALLNYRLYNDIATILVCLMVDEFEQRVYSTDLTGFTAADFDNIMADVIDNYMTEDIASDYLADMYSYWRMVVVDQPVYYISYAVSAIAAIDLYTMATDDYDAAMEAYRKLCEEPVEDGGFLENIRAAGLSGPFDKEFYKDFVDMIENP